MPHAVIRVYREADGSVPFLAWLKELEASEPKVYRKCLQRILLLEQLGYELRRPLADMLRDGIRELRMQVGTVNYRILYFFHGANIACLSHGFTKEAKIPDAEIDLAIQRKKQIERAPAKYTADWEV